MTIGSLIKDFYKYAFGMLNTSNEPTAYPISWSKGTQQKMYLSAKTHAVASFKDMIALLKQSMNSPAPTQTTTNDNW